MPTAFLIVVLVISCQRTPREDFTTLKRDLKELGQIAHLRFETSLLAPQEFVHAADQLAIDYRLQRAPRPLSSDADVRACSGPHPRPVF